MRRKRRREAEVQQNDKNLSAQKHAIIG